MQDESGVQDLCRKRCQNDPPMDEREAAGQEDSLLGKEENEYAALQYTCHKKLKTSQFTSSP
jgi:hypothetical protein